MPQLLIFKKFFLYSMIVGSFPVIAQATVEAGQSFLSVVIVLALMMATLLPEGLLVFKGYRKEIISGIQDGDGVTNKEDLRYFISWYGPFTALRGLIFFSLYSMVAPEWEPSDTLIWALVGVGTSTALPQIKTLVKSMKSDKD